MRLLLQEQHDHWAPFQYKDTIVSYQYGRFHGKVKDSLYDRLDHVVAHTYMTVLWNADITRSIIKR